MLETKRPALIKSGLNHLEAAPMECKAEREKIAKKGDGFGMAASKKKINWSLYEKAERERRAEKKRKISQRQRRKAFQEFITVAFHGKREIEV